MTRGLEFPEIARQALGHPDAATRGCAPLGQLSGVEIRVAPAFAPLAMHLAVAAGYATAQEPNSTTIAVFGEGSTTAGVFHESIALAVRHESPLVLVCKSQLWPERAPAEAGLIGDTVAERVRTMGMRSRRVDGADPLAVYRAIADALDHARQGKGPVLVETVVTHLIHDPPRAP